MHRLLKRQIRKYLSEDEQEKFRDFLDVINDAYVDFDSDIKQIENILEESSQELFNVNRELKKNLESKSAEAKTTSSRLEAIVDNINEVIFQANIEGEWMYLNPAWTKMTGFDLLSSIGTNVYEFVHPDDIELCRLKLKYLLEHKEKTNHFEVRFVTKSGSYKWCEIEERLIIGEDGKATGLSGFIKDISQRKSLEEEKNETDEKFRMIFEKSSVAYLIIKESRFLDCNQACLDLFGVKYRSNFIGKFVKDFSPEFQADGSRSSDKAMDFIYQAREKGFNKFDWIHMKEDGMEFPVEVILNPVQLAEGNIHFVALNDLSERKRVESELIAAKEKAEGATKAKAQFLSTMSHEIRTPMNAVIGVTHLLSENDPREDQLSNLNILKLSADNLMTLINDILDFSKIEAGKIELEKIDFNFRNFISNVTAGFFMKAKEKDLEFIVEIDPKIPAHLTGDPTRLSQIITNLCCNAIKFTDEGRVLLKADFKGGSDDKVNIQFEINDTGIGIPADKKDQIFESFSQADSNTTRLYGGTGLGLAITGKLIELMQGSIDVESEAGKGTSFFVNVSLKISLKSQPKLSFSDRHFTGCEKLKGMHVLVAEDNPMNVLIIKQFLKKWDVTYDIAKNGKIAFEKVQEADYDMVLMDLQMPEMDGYDASENIRKLEGEKYQELPIIAVTASAFNEIRAKVMSAGMTDFVTKPINPEELYVKLEKYAN
ncbi:PAS domain S-box protein [Marinifilum flexuosum]|uniref:Sensory/regulatory protein RpfC n=1 Tax=Marinifilum flexuosum TaxID=1117708 RepID=A0A419XAA9_9BACT|nr:PAS domain S-box protein [Marinifilum flexuosum]RKE04694.1 PAS domain S-box-containing protein [Marinifilum flexuosum]